jgi:adenine phosphoribosyltransferase
MGPESKGTVLAALVAVHLGVGMAEVRKDHKRASDDDPWLTRRTGPDYRDRGLLMGVRKSQLTPGDRVLFVDDWVATGSQMAACHGLVEDGGGTWVGAALVVDALEEPSTRRRLNVRSILHVREL